MTLFSPKLPVVSFLCALLFSPLATVMTAQANTPGGGNGTGAPVTLVDNGNGTVTMGNGIVSVLCNTSGAQLTQINYTYNNGGGSMTNQLLSGGTDGGEFYWETGGFGSGSFTYTPVANSGNYAEMDLLSTSAAAGTMDVHFSMLQGSPGFYVSVIWAHRAVDAAESMGETRDNIYAGSQFNWMCVDSRRNKLMEVTPVDSAVYKVYDAPVECWLWSNGIYAGRYEDKYKYSADFGVQRVWGWASVNASTGSGGRNVGLWNVLSSIEYYNGGPMKRELMSHIGTTILNMTHGGHYGGGQDGNWAAGEVWTQCYGPWFIYCNNVTNTLTNAPQAAAALYADAKAQAAAEATAWPYSWFNNANYASAANRGTISGQIVLNDIYNTNANPAGLWVGAIQQPSTTDGVYDFQDWCKCYQFWVKTGANGTFAISNVVAGTNYTLYAFGPGAAGMFMSQNQTGGNPDLTFNLPATPFSVTVTGGATNNLGPVTWTPTRVGPTVFEIGYPNRTAEYKYRHGDDWWVGDIGPSSNAPSPIWSKYFEYPFDFPNGISYVVGQSRWSTDWNFCQPAVYTPGGSFTGSSSTVTFNLPEAPGPGTNGSFYMANASDFTGPIVISVNGTNLGAISGVTSTPNAVGAGGYNPAFSGGNQESDTTIREGIHGCYSDERITFPGNLLNAGSNTVTILMNGGGAEDHIMYDYIRLELAGYVPPAPAGVTAYPGNNCNLLSWPATPGATSYDVLRTTTSGSNYASIAANVVGPVCGSGSNNATYLDSTALNGTTYYYVVQSVNPVGTSTNSPESPAAAPSFNQPSAAPTAPIGLVATVAHTNVTLTWNPSAGANYYSVWRSTLTDSGGGTSNILSTNILNNTNTTTTYTDNALTDGAYYSYFVTAANTAGTSPNSASISATALPAPPASAPANLALTYNAGQSALSWSPVPGAVGYVIFRSTNLTGPFQFPTNYVMSVSQTNYTDSGLIVGPQYSYVVVAMNAAGASADSAIISTPPPFPTSLVAIPTNLQISLYWSVSPGATSYTVERGTASGAETVLATNITVTNYTDDVVTNGVAYYYVVLAVGPTGPSANSEEVTATPTLGVPGTYWVNAVTSSAQDWNTGVNWDTGTAFPNSTNVAVIVNNGINANQTINLNQSITSGSMLMGAPGGSYNIAANGGTLTLDNTPVSASILELATSRGDVISAPIVNNGSLLITNLSTNIFALSGDISGATNGIIVYGNVTFTGINTYSGGLVIPTNSTVFSGSTAASLDAWGTGAITLMGGTLQFYGYGGSTGTDWGGCYNTLTVPAGQAGNLLLPPNFGNTTRFASILTGSGTLNVTVDYVRDSFAGNWSSFTGLVNVTPRSGTADFRINNASGYAGAAIYLNTGVNLYNVNAPGQTTDLGELGGASGSFIGPGSGASIYPTWRIGARNTSNTFAGVIADSGVTTLVKIGTGALTLSGPNTYSGGTTVSAGMLSVNNISGSGTGIGAVTVASGATLGGAGSIAGAVTVKAGGVFAPGNPAGALTINNSLTLAGGSTTLMAVSQLPLTNAAVMGVGALTNGGTLIVTNVGRSQLEGGDTFTLFHAASYSGNFTNVVLPALHPALAWNTNLLNTAGTVSVVITTQPVLKPLGVNSHGLLFNGSGGVPHATYYLLGSSNVTTPLSNWTPVLTNLFDASGDFNFTNPPVSGQPQEFYLLELP